MRWTWCAPALIRRPPRDVRTTVSADLPPGEARAESQAPDNTRGPRCFDHTGTIA